MDSKIKPADCTGKLSRLERIFGEGKRFSCMRWRWCEIRRSVAAHNTALPELLAALLHCFLNRLLLAAPELKPLSISCGR